MTRDEIAQHIKDLMGFRTDMGTVIATHIQLQQIALEKQVKWLVYPTFLQSERATTAITALDDGFDERVLKPEDYIQMVEDDGLWVVDADGEEHLLVKNEEHALRKTYKTCGPGLPAAWADSGDYLRLFPTPDAAYTLKMRYYQTQPALSAGSSTNRWSINGPNLLIGRTGMFLGGASNNARQEIFAALYREAKEALEVRAMDDMTSNRQYAMGENQ